MESLVEEHHQAMSGQSLEDVIAGSKSQSDQRKLMRPQPEQALKCPRCDSTNTKFCYYNNYSLSQPRYFCKGCRRYWTQGGSLRNVPVGGGCRKNRRSSSSSSSKKSQDAHNAALPITSCNGQLIPHLPSLAYDPSDLTLAFARLQRQPTMGLDDHHPLSLLRSNPITTHSSSTDVVGEHHHHGPTFATSGLLDALRTGFFDDPNGFHGVCSGFSHNSTASDQGGSVFPFGEMSSTGVPPLTTAATTTTTSSTITTATKQHQQGPYNNRSFRDGDHHQMEMWGMNWQYFNGEGSMTSDNPERDYWHGNGTAWHGIINSPLV